MGAVMNTKARSAEIGARMLLSLAEEEWIVLPMSLPT
jgi:hypothetical protein